jgi:hypothetical protein
MPHQWIRSADGRELLSHRVIRRHRKLLIVLVGALLPAGLLVAAGTSLAATTNQADAFHRHHHPSASPSAPASASAPAASASASASAPAAADNANCTLTVPPNPLTAAGLATPYRLSATNPADGPCHEANTAQSAFVQATVIDPATGKLSAYNPLVIDARTQAAAAPVTPALPAGGVVGIWFGYNGTNLTLRDSNGSLAAGKCVNGLNGSVFGQFADCNGAAFFTAANAAITAGKLAIPALGTAKDGMPCETVRDFGMIDQDQSDNVTGSYLVLGNGTTAQNTAANGNLGGQVITNASDNGLLDGFLDPAQGCTPFTAPDLANNGAMVTSLALNELQAAADQKAPVALVPPNDPMVLAGANQDQTSLQKTNLYRAGVDQPALAALGTSATTYCQDMVTAGQQRLQLDKNLTMAAPSPDPAAANSLFTFLAQRLNASFTNLGCGALVHMRNPVTVQTDGNGVATGARFATPTAPAGGTTTPVTTPSPSTSAQVPNAKNGF